jgi:hypothetical protein
VSPVSASETTATSTSRSADSTGSPAPSRSHSTALPSAPVPDRTRVSLSGSTCGPSRTTSPSMPRSRSRACRVAAIAAPRRAWPSRCSRARAASVLARTAPAGLVVAVASTPASSLAGSSRPVRARTRAAWLHAGSVLCALTTMASAPSSSACGGRSGWKPKCAAHAASTTRGTPCSCAAAANPATSPTVPTYDGSPTKTARASGFSASAARTDAGATPRGSPVDGSTSGRTHTGLSPASTSPSRSERCSVRLTTTVSPSPATARAMAWLACVAPPVENRQTSAPHRRAARDSASARRPLVSFIVSRPA